MISPSNQYLKYFNLEKVFNKKFVKKSIISLRSRKRQNLSQVLTYLHNDTHEALHLQKRLHPASSQPEEKRSTFTELFVPKEVDCFIAPET